MVAGSCIRRNGREGRRKVGQCEGDSLAMVVVTVMVGKGRDEDIDKGDRDRLKGYSKQKGVCVFFFPSNLIPIGLIC